MLKDRLDRILTWFTSPISNGPAEGFNSRIQSIKSAARGFVSSSTIESEFSSYAENSASNLKFCSHEIPRRTLLTGGLLLE
ncbi:MAG: transposase [Planctomyces sp.]